MAPKVSPLKTLKVSEFQIGARRIGVDLMAAIGSPDHPDRWPAISAVGWLHEKRTTPTADLDAWLDRTPEEVVDALAGMGFSLSSTDDDGDAGDPDDVAAVEEDPTAPAPAP